MYFPLRHIVAIVLFSIANLSFALEPGQAPPAVIESRDGQQIDILPAYQGKVLYIDFWASWCGPCRKSLPALNELYGEYGSRGFEVLAINLDEVEEDKQRFLQKYPVDYRIVDDPEGINAKSFQIPGLPTAYLVDRGGRIHSIHVGFKKNDKERIGTTVEQLLRQSTP